MAQNKKILIIGIDPFLIDFTTSEYVAFSGLTSERAAAGVKANVQQLIELGYDAELCWTDFGDTAMQVLKAHLQKKSFDGILIGAGIRIPDTNFVLFENMINACHEFAAHARIFFNTHPHDTVIAVKRWL